MLSTTSQSPPPPPPPSPHVQNCTIFWEVWPMSSMRHHRSLYELKRPSSLVHHYTTTNITATIITATTKRRRVETLRMARQQMLSAYRRTRSWQVNNLQKWRLQRWHGLARKQQRDMISDQNAKGRFDKFVLKMGLSKKHYEHSFAWKMFTHRMPTHPIVSRPKRKTLMEKYLFIYLFKTLVGWESIYWESDLVPDFTLWSRWRWWKKRKCWWCFKKNPIAYK